MRTHPTPAEAVLWARLRKRQVAGFKFRRQHVIAGWTALGFAVLVDLPGLRFAPSTPASSWTSIAHPYNSPSKSTAPSIDTEGDRTNSEHAFSHRSGRRLALLAEVHVGPRARSDASPAARIENYGVKIIRFASEDILDDVDQVIRAIRSALPERQSPCCLG